MFLKAYLKRGEKKLMWINKLKIALVEENFELFTALLDEVPQSVDKEMLIEASYLTQEILRRVELKKEETAHIMVQLKKNMDFLDSTHTPSTKFDASF